ncbi:hypothetical protein [Roseiflexus sp.]|uniref:hypothetical protein n=1 Tax=Roseiflexus sp. TaxID=2562120 RepID=UPI00398AE9A9
METTSKFILPGALLLLTYAFGFWLSVLGNPYNGALFNIHKLVALGAVVLAVIQTYNLFKGANTQFVVIALAAVSVLCIITLFATSALMSIGNLPHAPLLTVHRIALAALPLATISMVYFLIGSKP